MPVRWPCSAKAAARFALSVDLPTPPLPLAIANTRVSRSSAIPFVRSVTEPRSRAVSAARSSGVTTSNSTTLRFSSGSMTCSRAFRISSREASIAFERSNVHPAVGTLQSVGVVASARGVVKVYGQGRAALRILDGLDLDLHAGELVAVPGRYGSGN